MFSYRGCIALMKSWIDVKKSELTLGELNRDCAERAWQRNRQRVPVVTEMLNNNSAGTPDSPSPPATFLLNYSYVWVSKKESWRQRGRERETMQDSWICGPCRRTQIVTLTNNYLHAWVHIPQTLSSNIQETKSHIFIALPCCSLIHRCTDFQTALCQKETNNKSAISL